MRAPINTIKAARVVTGHTGGLGQPSKMPGFSTALSARDCRMGSKLRRICGSVCSVCYAMGGNYLFPTVALSHARRLAALDDPQWVEGMAFLINRRCGDE